MNRLRRKQSNETAEQRKNRELVEEVKRSIPKRGWAAWAAVWFCLVFGLAGSYAISHSPSYPVYEFHNVKVIKQVAPNKWWMEKDDGPFLWTGCPDFPNSDVIWAGYVARKVRFEELGKCKSILRSDLGFWWDRDANYNARGITQ